MQQQLHGKKIAILVEKGFEQLELTEPKDALEEAGAEVHIISPQDERVRGWNRGEWGQEFPIDVSLGQADSDEYDALVLPGGVINSDYLRMNEKAVAFTGSFFQSGKPVAAICHGLWILINAGVVEGRTLTSYPSLQTDLQNAGARWVNQEVVVDQGLVTSRRVDDIPAFNQSMIELFAEGRQEEVAVGQGASGGKTRSTATNQSWETGAGEGASGFDSPEETARLQRNTETRPSKPTDPYPPQADRNKDEEWKDRYHGDKGV